MTARYPLYAGLLARYVQPGFKPQVVGGEGGGDDDRRGKGACADAAGALAEALERAL